MTTILVANYHYFPHGPHVDTPKMVLFPQRSFPLEMNGSNLRGLDEAVMLGCFLACMGGNVLYKKRCTDAAPVQVDGFIPCS